MKNRLLLSSLLGVVTFVVGCSQHNPLGPLTGNWEIQNSSNQTSFPTGSTIDFENGDQGIRFSTGRGRGICEVRDNQIRWFYGSKWTEGTYRLYGKHRLTLTLENPESSRVDELGLIKIE